MNPADALLIAFGTAALATALKAAWKEKPRAEQLILTGRCRAPLWVLQQNLENAIEVRRPSAQYPLTRYWLEMERQESERGRISASLEFVEEVVRSNFHGLSFGKPRALIKHFGFIWELDEVLTPNQVELSISLYWQDLTPGRRSKFEEIVLRYLCAMTREVLARVEKSSSIGGIPLAAPPPGPTSSTAKQWIGPPPGLSGLSAPSGTAPAAAAPGNSHLRNSLGGNRQKNKIAFAEMSRPARVPAEAHANRTIEWPSPQDYHEAIQNPSSCFSDTALKQGLPEVDAMGMPRVASGAFASVYRIICRGGDRAVRCFLHPIRDQQFRYKVLSSFVGPSQLPWTVGFDYLSEGISIGSKWYPILTMDWVDGTPLNLIVNAKCGIGDKNALEDLRRRFWEMACGLVKARIAHGDLQHGNILVRAGQLVLVDYDGMFVPGLSNEKSNELGHPNYQHPARSESDFDATVDNFSTWVIESALLFLREDPSLWRFSYDDGESILFHRYDFVRPEQSELITTLFSHRSPVIRERVEILRELLSLSLAEIPPLDGVELPEASLAHDEAKPAPGIQDLSEGKSVGLPDWLHDLDAG